MATSTTPWVHSTALNCPNLLGAYCCIISVILLTPPTMIFIRTMGWLLQITARKGDMIRKKLHWLSDQFWFNLDIQTDFKITDNFNITLNLYNGTMSSFRKNNQYPCYINVGSKHPRQIFKHIPHGIIFRWSANSSNINTFTQSKHDYEMVLKDSGYKSKLVYKPIDEAVDVHHRNNRASHHTIWP